LSTRSLKPGRLTSTIINARINARNASKILSPINCVISSLFFAPATLRIPTSFARFSLRAVLKFMKLIQAINKIKAAIIANSFTNSILPPTYWPFSDFEYSQPSANGWVNTCVVAGCPSPFV
jgi:hypothetical protein